MSKSDVTGINEPALNQLILDIHDYVEKINRILVNIDDLISETSTYYICPSASLFRDKFTQLKGTFPIVNSNIMSYADDLVRVKANYANFNTDLKIAIKKGTTNIEEIGKTESAKLSSKLNSSQKRKEV